MRGVAGKPTIGMRIVVHLSRSSRFQEDYVCPRETTQDGIAEKLGIGRGHAASELRVLIKRKLVKFELKHIPGVGIRKRAYFLTPAGEILAKQVKERMGWDGTVFGERNVVKSPPGGGIPPSPAPAVAEHPRPDPLPAANLTPRSSIDP